MHQNSFKTLLNYSIMCPRQFKIQRSRVTDTPVMPRQPSSVSFLRIVSCSPAFPVAPLAQLPRGHQTWSEERLKMNLEPKQGPSFLLQLIRADGIGGKGSGEVPGKKRQERFTETVSCPQSFSSSFPPLRCACGHVTEATGIRPCCGVPHPLPILAGEDDRGRATRQNGPGRTSWGPRNLSHDST